MGNLRELVRLDSVEETIDPLCTQEIGLEEVRKALFDRTPNKAPGHDGLGVDFYRALVFDDTFLGVVTSFFNRVFLSDSFPKD
jgi:hypothetical protein